MAVPVLVIVVVVVVVVSLLVRRLVILAVAPSDLRATPRNRLAVNGFCCQRSMPRRVGNIGLAIAMLALPSLDMI